MKNKSNEDSKKSSFLFRLNNISDFETIKKIRNYNELGFSSQSEMLCHAIQKFLDSDTDDLKQRKEKAIVKINEAKAIRIDKKEDGQLHKLNLENEILERTLLYYKTFGNKPPSQSGQIAIKQGTTQSNLVLQKNFLVIKNYAGYVGKCSICTFDTGYLDNGLGAEKEIDTHLQNHHNTRLCRG